MPKLPPMPVDVANNNWRAVTADLQCNILKHHGRPHARHLFFSIMNAAKCKSALKKFKLKSALEQIQEADARESNPGFDGGSIVTVSLSATGLKKLSATISLIDKAFNAGMKARKQLMDDINLWEEPLQQEIDMLIIVADADKNKMNAHAEEIIKFLSSSCKFLYSQTGEILRNEFGIGIEHFGYADGVSQPVYLKDEIKQMATRKIWSDEADAKNLLVTDNAQNVLGSYFVFRKLEQNVAGFKSAEKRNTATIFTKEHHLCPVKDSSGKINDELPGAMTVGRFEDGTEVINHDEELKIQDERLINNDFDYKSKDATKCPFHAHIRATNPRSDLGSQQTAKDIRITRRGIPYNDIGRNINDMENDQPTGDVGLLFMCYQSSIENQFEVIQSNWANEGVVGNNPKRAIDGIIGQGTNSVLQKLPVTYGSGNGFKTTDFSGFVTNKGGEYFFTPLISFF